MLVDREDERREDRSAHDTKPVDLPGLKVQIESLTRRSPGTGTGNGTWIALVV